MLKNLWPKRIKDFVECNECGCLLDANGWQFQAVKSTFFGTDFESEHMFVYCRSHKKPYTEVMVKHVDGKELREFYSGGEKIGYETIETVVKKYGKGLK